MKFYLRGVGVTIADMIMRQWWRVRRWWLRHSYVMQSRGGRYRVD